MYLACTELKKLKFSNMAIQRPFNLQAWIRRKQGHFKSPPVGNKNLYADAGDYIVMIVGGPNARKDYHYNETEELFYHWRVTLKLPFRKTEKAVKVPIKEGEMYLHPAKVPPFAPARPANTVGLVIERKREPDHQDGLMWVL